MMKSLRSKTDVFALTVETIVSETMKRIAPLSDDLRLADAHRQFGRRWVDHHVACKNITTYRRGTARNSAVYMSRTALLALRKTEAEQEITLVG